MTLPRSTGPVQGNEPNTAASNQIWKSIKKLANSVVAYQILPADDLVLCDTSAGNNPNVSLPANPDDGDTYTVRDGADTAGTTAITVAATGGKTIQGLATTTINTNNGGLKFIFSQTLAQWMADSSTGPSNTPAVATPTTLVYRPGGSVSQNVYTSLAALATVARTIVGPVVIELDDSAAAIAIPGVAYDFRGPTNSWDRTMRGRGTSSVLAQRGSTAVTITDGATFAGINEFAAMTIVFAGNTPCVSPPTGNSTAINFRNNVWVTTSGTAPFVRAVAGAVVPLNLYDTSLFAGGLCGEAVGAGATMGVDLFDGAFLNANTLASSGGGVVNGNLIGISATAVVAQSGIAGGILFLQTFYNAASVAIVDAAATSISVDQGKWRTVTANSQNSVLTLLNTNATARTQLQITKPTREAFTYRINDSTGAELCTFPALSQGSALFQFDGTQWKLRQVGTST